jgi:GalNAc5-diNAcBac-PP-undecaprenol beta-1,3-glucosyltransferase
VPDSVLDATVLIPTHNHGALLELAAGSALNQTLQRIEVIIVGDGATEPTRAVARGLAASDSRVEFVDHPKGPRLGEVYRHALLQRARGRIVAYLSDDDLWLPDHLERMQQVLSDADFANGFGLCFDADGAAVNMPVDLSLPYSRNKVLSGENPVPLSCAAHTLEAYLRLPFGWRSAPINTFTDLYMWQQFLSQPNVRAVSGTVPTVLVFPSPPRRQWSAERRLTELQGWFAQLDGLGAKPEFLRDVVAALSRSRLHVQEWLEWTLDAQRRTRDEREVERAAQRSQTEAFETKVAELHARSEAFEAEVAELRRVLAEAKGSRAWRAVNRLRELWRTVARAQGA